MGMVHRMIAPIATVKDVYNLKKKQIDDEEQSERENQSLYSYV